MLRIHLSGRMTIEAEGVRLDPRDFPGRQGRIAFAFLATSHRGGPVSRSALADALWSGRPPPSWDAALSSVVSKLRSLLDRTGHEGSDILVPTGGCYGVRLPPGSWIDHEAAADSIHEAEAALQAVDARSAYGPSAVAHHIARRPFLPGEEGFWLDEQRQKLNSILVRALECRAEVYIWNREHTLAVEAAADVVRLRPFRESGYRLLMRAHSSAGNAAEALHVYERCRALISEELGVGPSRETRAVHAKILESL